MCRPGPETFPTFGMLGGFLLLRLIVYIMGFLFYRKSYLPEFMEILLEVCWWTIYGTTFYIGCYLHYRKFSQQTIKA
jgi:hypothetical protein